MVSRVYWPLLGGFIAFILVSLILGWILGGSRRGDTDGH
jgi:hypothetical protein